jgi:hypothetical protein
VWLDNLLKLRKTLPSQEHKMGNLGRALLRMGMNYQEVADTDLASKSVAQLRMYLM